MTMPLTNGDITVDILERIGIETVSADGGLRALAGARIAELNIDPAG